MAKYHVNDKNEFNLCRAKRGKCPYGNGYHFESKAEVQKYVDTVNACRHGIGFPNQPGWFDMGEGANFHEEWAKEYGVLQLILLLQGKKIDGDVSGAQYEAFLAKSLADSKGLRKMCVFDKDGKFPRFADTDGDMEAEARKVEAIRDKVNKETIKFLKKVRPDVNWRDNKNYISTLYYDDESEEYVVQLIANGELVDGLVYREGKVYMVEAKGLKGDAAQIASNSSTFNEDGVVVLDSLRSGVALNDKLIEELKDVDISDFQGVNYEFQSLTDDEALDYFLDMYEDKASIHTLTYIGEDGGSNYVQVGDRPRSEVKADLNERGVTVKLIGRANKDFKKIYFGNPKHPLDKNPDWQRLKVVGEKAFKFKLLDEPQKFSINDLNTDYLLDNLEPGVDKEDKEVRIGGCRIVYKAPQFYKNGKPKIENGKQKTVAKYLTKADLEDPLRLDGIIFSTDDIKSPKFSLGGSIQVNKS